MTIRIAKGIASAACWFRQVVAEHVFQTFEVMKAVETAERRQFWVQAIKRPWKILTAYPRFAYYSVWDNERIVLLAPFKIQSGVAHVLGDGCEINYVDFLIGEAMDEQLREAVKALFVELKERGVREVQFMHLAESSRIWAVLQNLGYQLEGVRRSISVRIDFSGKDHATYFASLGKHARQNVRTAYNRLTRDAHKFALILFSNSDQWNRLDSVDGCNALLQAHAMYHARQSCVYGLRGGGDFDVYS